VPLSESAWGFIILSVQCPSRKLFGVICIMCGKFSFTLSQIEVFTSSILSFANFLRRKGTFETAAFISRYTCQWLLRKTKQNNTKFHYEIIIVVRVVWQ
jgi:hypothetical protein